MSSRESHLAAAAPPWVTPVALAVASMLAPSVKTVCVDIDPSAVERAVEQQPLQSIGLVTDVEPFLRELADCIGESETKLGDRKEAMSRE